MVAIRRLKATAATQDLLQVLEQDGGVIIEGLFAVEDINLLRNDFMRASESFKPGTATQGMDEDGKAFVGANTTRFSSLGNLSPTFLKLLDNPVYAALADAILLPHCGSYWVNTGQAMLIGPGSAAQGLHRDCFNWPQVCAPTWPDCPEVTLSAMIALEEVTEAMGATRVIPGSHRWPDFTNVGDASMTCAAELSPGDALIYSGKLVHGGGANQTADQWRLAFHLSFVLGWLTPEESSPLDYTDAELQQHSPRVQRLLGHRSYDPRPHFGGGLWLRHVRKIEDWQPQ